MEIEELDSQANQYHNIISSNVKRYRKLKNISQLQLALDIGLSGNAFIARAERRTQGAHFNIEHLVKIAIILDVKIEFFFEE